MSFATQAQQLITRLQKALPNIAEVYPDYKWESTLGSTSFAVVLCCDGKYFGSQLMRVHTVVSAPGNQQRYFLEILKSRALAFASFDDTVDYLHKIGHVFSNTK